MPNYSDLELQTLMDLLVTHTNEYSRMRTFSVYTVEEIAQLKQALWELQIAIKLKLEQTGDTMDYIIPDLPDYNNLSDTPSTRQEQLPQP